MTDTYPTTAQVSTEKRRRHVFRWFMIGLQALFVVWIVADANSGTSASDCKGLSAQTCQSAHDVGTSIGVGLIVVLWFVVDVIVLLARLVVLLGRRRSS